VLDPFMGVGSTGVAALGMGREFVGMELEQNYFDAAKKRIEASLTQQELFAAHEPVEEVEEA
jgi:site-specific DNA-methyltransferase (adenine-specific)